MSHKSHCNFNKKNLRWGRKTDINELIFWVKTHSPHRYQMAIGNPKQIATQRQDTTFLVCFLRLIYVLRNLLSYENNNHLLRCTNCKCAASWRLTVSFWCQPQWHWKASVALLKRLPKTIGLFFSRQLWCWSMVRQLTVELSQRGKKLKMQAQMQWIWMLNKVLLHPIENPLRHLKPENLFAFAKRFVMFEMRMPPF